MNADWVASRENAIDAAVRWLELTLVGNIASAIAIVAVAWFGLMMLGGRLSTRLGVQLILGCFIVFGASTIASGLMSVLQSSDAGAVGASIEVSSQPIIPIAPVQQRPAQPYDPYAGAALPPRR